MPPLRRRNPVWFLALPTQQFSLFLVAVISNRRDKRGTVSWWYLQNRVFSRHHRFCCFVGLSTRYWPRLMRRSSSAWVVCTAISFSQCLPLCLLPPFGRLSVFLFFHSSLILRH